LVEIGILNIGRISGVVESPLMAHCQPTGDLGDGIVNRRRVLRPRMEERYTLSLWAVIA
jgi:hypothetical protein